MSDQTQTQDVLDQSQTTEPNSSTEAEGNSEIPLWVREDPERTYEYIRELRGEAASHRDSRNTYKQERDTLRSKLDAVEQERLEKEGDWKTRAEQAEQRLTESVERMQQLEAHVQEVSITQHVTSQATERGFIDAEVVMALVRPGLKIDEDGASNLDSLLDELASSKPYLLREQNEERRETGIKIGGSSNDRTGSGPTQKFKQFMGIENVSPFSPGGVQFPE